MSATKQSETMEGGKMKEYRVILDDRQTPAGWFVRTPDGDDAPVVGRGGPQQPSERRVRRSVDVPRGASIKFCGSIRY